MDGTLLNSPVGFTYDAELGTIDIGRFDNTASRKYRNVADVEPRRLRPHARDVA